MKIDVNGEPLVLEAEVASIRTLVEQLGHKTRQVAIEQNGTIIPRAMHAQTSLSDGDRIEIVTLVGGG